MIGQETTALERTMKGRARRTTGRSGVTLIELLVVLLVVSILAAIATPQLRNVIVKARAADAMSEMRTVRVALYNYQTDQQAWPPEASAGSVPAGLAAYLPDGYNLVREGYTMDYENWGGSPFTVGISMITSDSTLGRHALEIMPSPKWSSGTTYTWVFE